MSLTAHLSNKSSPVRQWVEDQFPRTHTLARDTNRELCRSDECVLPSPSGSDPSLVGTAVDYLLRACLRSTGLEKRVATHAVERLDRLPRVAGRAGLAESLAIRRFKELRPSRRELPEHEWRELCGICLLLARFEQYFRTGGMNLAVIELLIPPLRAWDGEDLGGLLAEIGVESSLQDLATLGRAAVDDHRHLERKRPMFFNPNFALSLDLGGADADLIASGTLIDWKATSTRSVAGRQVFWQLLGYALADMEDHYEIRSVALGALRWRTRVEWSIADFLDELSGGKHLPIKTLRLEFASVVICARDDELRRRARTRAAHLERRAALIKQRAAVEGQAEE